MDFQLLIKTKMLKKLKTSCFQALIYAVDSIYHAYKCYNAFNIYEHAKCHAQLS